MSVRRGPEYRFASTLEWSNFDSLAPNNRGCFWFVIVFFIFNFHCCQIRFCHLELYLRILGILVSIFAQRSGWNVAGRGHEVEPMLSSNIFILIRELRRLPPSIVLLLLRSSNVMTLMMFTGVKCSRIGKLCLARPSSFAGSWEFHRKRYTFRCYRFLLSVSKHQNESLSMTQDRKTMAGVALCPKRRGTPRK